jgi:hypothetical protein
MRSIGSPICSSSATALEEGRRRQSVESGWKPYAGCPAVEEIGGDRLRHRTTPRGDLVEVQVLEAMLEE